MTALHRHSVGMRELSQRTAKVMALVRAGQTVDVTDRGQTIARIVPAAADRYDQLIAAGMIRRAGRPFDAASLPEPGPAEPGRSTDDLLAELRGER